MEPRPIEQPRSFQTSPFAAMDFSEDREEKQLLLLQLNELKRQGSKLSKEFTMEDSVGVLRCELNFHKDVAACESWTQMIIMGITVGSVVLEQVNARLGPFLELDGLSTEIGTKIEPLKPAIRKIYAESYSSFQLSAMKQLMLGLATIVFAHHAQQKWGKGSAVESVMSKITGIVANAPTKQAMKAPESEPEAAAPTPAPAPAAPASVAEGSTTAPARVPLRPPSANIASRSDTSAIIE